VPSPRAVRNLQAAAVLVGAVLAIIFVPGEVLLPVAAIVMVVAVAGVFALKAYMKRVRAASGGEVDAEVRLILLTEVGLGLAMLGMVAFFVLVWELS
jgi:hypothetical protein